MEHNTIEWQTESSESKTEQVSPDGRWHLDTKVERNGVRRVTLVNYDVLGSPIGIGESPLECWREFVAHCERFAAKLEKVKAEAAAVLAGLENDGKEEGK